MAERTKATVLKTGLQESRHEASLVADIV